MFAQVCTGGIAGVDAFRIEVEVDCCGGIGQIQIVGLPDAAVKESQERVRAAIKSCSFLMPPGKKWIVNLAPADTRKEGPAYDLPIAAGILAATGLIPRDHLRDFWLIGELSLNGTVRTVSGVLPIAIRARDLGAKGLIVPDGNVEEAGLVDNLQIYPVSHLLEVCQILRDPSTVAVYKSDAKSSFQKQLRHYRFDLDFSDIKGQGSAKRAIQIACAGRHNILMVGPPGSGKSMLASRMPGIMPPLTFEEAIELTKLYSVAGRLTEKGSFVLERPFRSPHHSASMAGLIGGGNYPKPGEVSLSHLGVLFLDELTEFSRATLDHLRQPMEGGTVTISRAAQTLTYPASFILVGACNPCPCGYRNDVLQYCACTPSQAERYWARLSGPFLDRIDLIVPVRRLNEKEMLSFSVGESSETMRLRVLRAVETQRERNVVAPLRAAARELGMCRVGAHEIGAECVDNLCGDRLPSAQTITKERGPGFVFNGQLSNRQIAKHCQIDSNAKALLANAISSLGLSARAYDRILRVARTIADIDGIENITLRQMTEAITYRQVRRPF